MQDPSIKDGCSKTTKTLSQELKEADARFRKYEIFDSFTDGMICSFFVLIGILSWFTGVAILYLLGMIMLALGIYIFICAYKEYRS